MNLPIPVVGVDPGPDYALNIDNSLTLLDAHTHDLGKGVQITPSGLNLNADLTLLVNNLIDVRSVRFSPQSSLFSLAADIGCLYEQGVDLYYRDGVGNNVRITQSGGVAGSPGSISNLTSPASASYVAGTETFVWQSDANTPANMDFASAIFRNLVANSKGLTLNPPNAMAANYSLVLPPIPVSNSFLTIDTSGNITGSIPINASLTTANLSASAGILGTQIANQTIAQNNLATRGNGNPATAGQIMLSTSSGTFNINTGVNQTVVSATLTTTGRPVWIGLVPDGTGADSYIATGTTPAGSALNHMIYRDVTQLSNAFQGNNNTSTGQIIPPSSIWTIDYAVTAGTYVYSYQAFNSFSGGVANNLKLIAYEI